VHSRPDACNRAVDGRARFCFLDERVDVRRRQWIEGAKESQALDESRHESIDRYHALGLELAEGDMNRPLIRTCGAETVPGQVRTLSDAHAGVTDQQEGICSEIVSAQELLLQELILFGGEGPGKFLRCTWNVLATNQAASSVLLFVHARSLTMARNATSRLM